MQHKKNTCFQHQQKSDFSNRFLQHWHKVTSSSPANMKIETHFIVPALSRSVPDHTRDRGAAPRPATEELAAPPQPAEGRGIRERRGGTVPWACPGAGAVPSGLPRGAATPATKLCCQWRRRREGHLWTRRSSSPRPAAPRRCEARCRFFPRHQTA